jgi:hypothetical protein
MAQRVNIANLEKIRQENPLLAEALESISLGVGAVADQTNAMIHGNTAAPAGPSSLTVTAAGGIFDGAIEDSSPVTRGINYFVEISDNSSFVKPRVLDLGQSRNFRENLGNQTLYFRAYSSYPTSARSPAVYHGGSESNPTAVVGGGATTGPVLSPSQGSGTQDGANGGDGGFGNASSRGFLRLPE